MSNETSSIQQGFNLKEVGGGALSHHDDSMTAKTASSYINISATALASQNFNKNGQGSNASPIPNLNTAGQIQEGILTNASRGGTTTNPQSQTLFQERTVISIPDTGNPNAPHVNLGIPAAQNMASNGQLNQPTNLSASLAQLLADGQQLPQLHVAHNSHDCTFANSESTVAVKPDSAATIQPNQAVEPRKQYDPICDSIEHGKLNVYTNPPDKKLELLSKSLSPSALAAAPDFNKFCSEQESNEESSQLNQPAPAASSEATKENNGAGSGEGNKVQEQDKTAQKNGPLENSDGDGKADESKKNKDAKGNRAFKFSLVEFVKDLLKPAWKEGQMSKDAYKNIVKKVVDKVTGTMHSASIPTTQEKIEQYLSVSKPKLTKLVQAYAEKFQKDK
ncbi:PROTEIN FRIGIDA-ESSENTIAL 1 [Salix koriyanagi]|uniref:PROTEIN FRIGIDA-ESSENTIAL 1 n=1 Tax=Salix koriyanagi TaxID=2511006 RepID=A0A9Q0P788_9ROSI|nr:PROTEIN FRIGIDA-ESSENTIAL 1 [Salix koriyanagi]